MYMCYREVSFDVQQRETAQKIVFHALREATVTETVVRQFRYTTQSPSVVFIVWFNVFSSLKM